MPKDATKMYHKCKIELCKIMQVVKMMGFMGMHEWMACLQQGTLVPGPGLALGQPNLLLVQAPLDDDLILPKIHKTSQKHTKSITKQSYTQLR